MAFHPVAGATELMLLASAEAVALGPIGPPLPDPAGSSQRPNSENLPSIPSQAQGSSTTNVCVCGEGNPRKHCSSPSHLPGPGRHSVSAVYAVGV